MVNLSFLRNKVWGVDGITITVGMLIAVLIIAFLIYRAKMR